MQRNDDRGVREGGVGGGRLSEILRQKFYLVCRAFPVNIQTTLIFNTSITFLCLIFVILFLYLFIFCLYFLYSFPLINIYVL